MDVDKIKFLCFLFLIWRKKLFIIYVEFFTKMYQISTNKVPGKSDESLMFSFFFKPQK